jgi:hypothetical protein
MYRITNLAIGLGIAGMVFANAYAGLADGLVADYPFNGNADDESGNGYHGTVISALLCEDRNGNTDSAYCFDGINDYINIGQEPRRWRVCREGH